MGELKEHLRNYCEDPTGKQYYISTQPLPYSSSYNCETMVFNAKDGEVTDWMDLYCEINNPYEARKRHMEIVDDIQSGLFFK